MITKSFAAVLVLVGAMCSIGCSSGPKAVKHEITVSLDMAAWQRAGGVADFQVDVVRPTPDQVDDLEGYDVSRYFSAGDTFRQDLNPRTFAFNRENTAAQSIRANDSIWDEWGTADRVFILAQLPRSIGERARRESATLLSGEWQDRRIDIRIAPSGVSITSRRASAGQ